MKISVQPGDVQIASVEARRHTGGIYTIQISTPFENRPGLKFGSRSSSVLAHSQDVFLFAAGSASNATRVTFTPTDNDEEEALMEGLFDVLDGWSRYSVTLIAVPASVFEEAEEAGSWAPQGSVDYLAG
jgi:hypothetical protein